MNQKELGVIMSPCLQKSTGADIVMLPAGRLLLGLNVWINIVWINIETSIWADKLLVLTNL